MFSPPRMIMSFILPTICPYPCLSITAVSLEKPMNEIALELSGSDTNIVKKRKHVTTQHATQCGTSTQCGTNIMKKKKHATQCGTSGLAQ